MVRIVTDTASDITLNEAKRMNIDIVPFEIFFHDRTLEYEKTDDFSEFYSLLIKNKEIPTTSSPTTDAFLRIYMDAQKKREEVLVLCLSSGLSSIIGSAQTAQEKSGYDNVKIIDTHQASLAQRSLVEYAIRLRNHGLNALDIAEKIEAIRDDIVVCGIIDTLDFLKEGGRIPSGLATVGELLQIKPIITLEQKELKTIGKAHGRRSAINILHRHMEIDGFDPDAPVYFGYTSDKGIGESFMLDTMDKYGLKQIHLLQIGSTIGTHCGTNCISIAYLKKNSTHKADFLRWMPEDYNT